MRVHGPALKEIRERSGFNLSDFAAEAGISTQYLCDLEAGRKPGSPRVIRQIADVLKCRIVAIISTPEQAA